MLAVLDWKRLKSSLVHMALAGRMSMSMPTLSMSQRQPARELRQLSVFDWVDNQVPMVRHQTVRQQASSSPFYRLLKNLFKGFVVTIFFENWEPRVRSVENVINKSTICRSFRSTDSAKILSTTPKEVK